LAGELKLGHQVSLSYYAQHVSDDLDLNDTVFESLEKAAHPDVDRQTILNLAGSLLFSGEAVEKRVRVLSGGEKSRVALGQILLRRSPLLLLDEPTNHLDFDTVEALTEALRDYAGTVIVVSHDRSFIGRVATQILEIRDGRAEVYPGTYDDYLWSLEKGSLKERFNGGVTTSGPSKTKVVDKAVESEARHEPRDQTKRYQAEAKESAKRLKKQEALLEVETARLAKLNADIVGAAGARLQELSAAIDQCYRDVQALEESILELMEKQAAAEDYLKN
jgi:ATP-binding cassette subfamily F protein 3